MMGRELLNLVGININWIMEPAANCFRTGNHLGIQPHTFKDNIDFTGGVESAEEAAEAGSTLVERRFVRSEAPRASE